MPSPPHRTLILASFVLFYTVAAVMPALHWQGQQEKWHGYYAMIVGIWGIKSGVYAWLANPAALLAVHACMNGKRKNARVLSLISLGLAMHTVTLFGRVIPLGKQEFNVVKLSSLGTGFHFWLLALATPLLYSFLAHEPAVEKQDSEEEERAG
jgi:hypothetical protein